MQQLESLIGIKEIRGTILEIKTEPETDPSVAFLKIIMALEGTGALDQCYVSPPELADIRRKFRAKNSSELMNKQISIGYCGKELIYIFPSL